MSSCCYKFSRPQFIDTCIYYSITISTTLIYSTIIFTRGLSASTTLLPLFCQLQVYYLKFGSDLRSFMKIKGPLLNPPFFWFFGRKHSISNPPYSEKYLFLTASLSHFLSSFLFFLFVCCLRSQVINSSSILSSDKIII